MSSQSATILKFSILVISILLMMIGNIYFGSVRIAASEVSEILASGSVADSPYSYIIFNSRIPQMLTAILTGAGLSVSGLMLQVAFRNPLAGPSILGVTSGASLGVALVILGLGGSLGAAGMQWGGYTAVIAGALIGSLSVMAVLLMFSTWLRNALLLLITGIMVGYLTSSIITLLNFTATTEGVHNYTMWGMGNFNGVSWNDMPLFSTLTILGLVFAILMVKPLNIIQLGPRYAAGLGIDMKRVRNKLLIATGILTAVATAYCGPVSFIGLSVPHIARMIMRTANQRILVPASMLGGASVGLLCNLLCVIPQSTTLPLNGVTPLVGVPVIIYVILKGRRK
ncbi:MAG: iron ABC transporter permease [Muribaculaceae bacterium]|nr:iron ABC transporter permease [Muribaculaceae bacterium]